MYLYLKKQHPETFLVPCYDMDLIWHTHQVNTIDYGRETSEILGFILKHDDSVNDRSEGSKLNNADEVTRKLWRETFQVSFPRPGSMFRGNPPYGKLNALNETYQKTLLLPREIDVQIDRIQLGTEELGPLPEDAVISVSLEKGGKDSKLFKKVLKKAASLDQPLEIRADKPGESLAKFSTAKDDFPRIKVSINKPSKGVLGGFLPLQGRRHSLASSDSPIDIFGLLPQNMNALTEEKTDISLVHKLKNGNHKKDSDRLPAEMETTVNLELSNERFGKPKDTCFKILVGSFYDCIIPEDVESLWGPIPLQKLPRGVDNTCRAVTHGILNARGERPLTAYLIHSLPLQQSAVQVFAGDKMSVVGHLVGLEQIGYEKILGMTMAVST